MQQPPGNPNWQGQPYPPQQPSSNTGYPDYPPQQPLSNTGYSGYPPQQQYMPDQPYQQQPWQQQTPMPPAYQPQQPQRKRGRGCVISAVVVVVILVAIIAAAAANGGKGSPTTTSSNTTNSSATQPAATTAPSSANKVGQSATVDQWTATVNKVSTSQGSQYNEPDKSGDVFLLISVTVVNATGQTQTASSLLQFSIKDQDGQKYDETIDTDAPSSPDGNLPSGQKLTGTIAYEVPASTHAFLFSFTPSLESDDEADWSLSV